MAAIQNDFIIKAGLLVSGNTTVPATTNLVTSNVTRAIARPTIDFNFTRSTSLDPRLKFSRSSIGTYVGKDGTIKYAGVNQPRFDYDTTTGQSKGILIEEQITNLLTYSTLIGSGSWNTRAGTTSVISSGIAPDGSNNATLVTNTSGDGYVWQALTPSPSTTYVLSVYAAKASGTPTIRFNAYTGTAGQAFTSGATALTSNNTRYSFSFSSTASVSAGDFGFYIISGSALLWGAQLETTTVGSNNTNPTSIIPTAASQVTRSADTLTFSPDQTLYNPTQGTMFIDFDANNTSYSFAINGSALSEIATVRGPTDVGTWNGVVALDAINSAANANTGVKYAIAYNTNQPPQASLVLNGGNISSSSTQSLQYGKSSSILYFGNGAPGNYRVIDGHIRRFTYWPIMLTNAQIKQLTTST
jgi:hypothetical protein